VIETIEGSDPTSMISINVPAWDDRPREVGDAWRLTKTVTSPSVHSGRIPEVVRPVSASTVSGTVERLPVVSPSSTSRWDGRRSSRARAGRGEELTGFHGRSAIGDRAVR
jgi:hypothetical protein